MHISGLLSATAEEKSLCARAIQDPSFFERFKLVIIENATHDVVRNLTKASASFLHQRIPVFLSLNQTDVPNMLKLDLEIMNILNKVELRPVKEVLGEDEEMAEWKDVVFRRELGELEHHDDTSDGDDVPEAYQKTTVRVPYVGKEGNSLVCEEDDPQSFFKTLNATFFSISCSDFVSFWGCFPRHPILTSPTVFFKGCAKTWLVRCGTASNMDRLASLAPRSHSAFQQCLVVEHSGGSWRFSQVVAVLTALLYILLSV